MSAAIIEKLAELRHFGGDRVTIGLPDDVIARFADADPALVRAVDEAIEAHRALRAEHADLLRLPELELTRALQERLVNFYPDESVNPYVAIAAAGPWLVTAHGAVLHDNGGYGMLGAGHGPLPVLDVMARSWVMANVMTPSFSHKRFTDRLAREIGHSRGTCPYARFVCLNSGSEAVTLTARIADVNAKVATDAGGPHAGKPIVYVALKGSFHGRTGEPAQFSGSCIGKYRSACASFRDKDNVLWVEPNDLSALHATFACAEADGLFIHAMYLEPVMGEGDPGKAITREFYDLARQLTRAHGGLLVVDSVQAGFRGAGCLSIVDYPGFQSAEGPDLETYSKALNAGQYPLSVVALSERAAALYVKGIYGNTMTTNPRALEVACAVLDGVTPEWRRNIVDRGAEMVAAFQALADELPGVITKVQGTGLIVSVEVDGERLKVVGWGGLEETCRKLGVGVIHGGENSLRYTPHFRIGTAEIGLLVDNLRRALKTLLA